MFLTILKAILALAIAYSLFNIFINATSGKKVFKIKEWFVFPPWKRTNR